MKHLNFASAPLLPLAACLIVGMAAGCHWQMGWGGWVLLAALAIPALTMSRWPWMQSLTVAACTMLAGMLLMNREQQRYNDFFGSAQQPFKAVVTSQPVERPHTMAVDVLTTDGQWTVRCYIINKVEAAKLHIGDAVCIGNRPQPSWRWGTGRCLLKDRQWQRTALNDGETSMLLRSRLWFLKQREHLLKRYRDLGVDGQAYAVMAAMTLGDRSALPTGLRTAYANSGVAHVLALSGLHLGIVCSLFLLLLQGRRWRSLAQVVLVLAIWSFAFLVGLPASVLRAATMISVYALLSMGRRRGLSVNVLAFTAIVMLLLSPRSLFDVGFQLSFAAVFAILTLMPLWNSWVSSQWLQSHRWCGWLWSLLTISVSAQIGTAPLVAYYFGQLSTCFLLTNLVAIPATWLLLHGTLFMLLLPWMAPAVMALANGLNAAVEWIARQPVTSIAGLHPSGLQVVLVYVAIGAVVMALMRMRRLI